MNFGNSNVNLRILACRPWGRFLDGKGLRSGLGNSSISGARSGAHKLALANSNWLDFDATCFGNIRVNLSACITPRAAILVCVSEP